MRDHVALYDGNTALDVPASEHPSYYGPIETLILPLPSTIDIAGSSIPEGADAAYRLGIWLLRARGALHDPNRAKTALTKAAEAGDARAMWELGLLLAAGSDGVPPDLVLAADYLLAAQRADDPFALMDLNEANRRLPKSLRQIIQERLKAAGYYNGAIDGDIGPGTHKALLAYRRG